MHFEELVEDDPDFVDKLEALNREFGLRDYDRFMALWQDKEDRKFPVIYADSAASYLAKKREALEAWTADYEARLEAEEPASELDYQWF